MTIIIALELYLLGIATGVVLFALALQSRKRNRRKDVPMLDLAGKRLPRTANGMGMDGRGHC